MPTQKFRLKSNFSPSASKASGSFSLGGGLGVNNQAASGGFGLSGGGANGLFDAGQAIGGAGDGGGGAGGGMIINAVSQFAQDLLEAQGMAKAGGALASVQARAGLGRMAEDKLNLGSPKRLGYWLR